MAIESRTELKNRLDTGDTIDQEATHNLLDSVFLPATDTPQSSTGDITLTSFVQPNYYGTLASPLTGNITIDDTGAIDFGVAFIYHSDSTEPTINGVTVGKYGFTYITDALNIIVIRRHPGPIYLAGTLGGVMTGIDLIAPTFSSPVIENSDPDLISITASEVVTLTNLGFTVNVNGSPVTVSSVTGSGTTTIGLQLASAVANGDTVTYSYDSGTGDVQDAASNALASFTDVSVTNNVSAAFTDPNDYRLTRDMAFWFDFSDSGSVTTRAGTPPFAESVDDQKPSPETMETLTSGQEFRQPSYDTGLGGNNVIKTNAVNLMELRTTHASSNEIPASSKYTVIFACRATTVGDATLFCKGSGTDQQLRYSQDFQGDLRIYVQTTAGVSPGTLGDISGVFTDTNQKIISHVWDGTDHKVYVNGTLEATVSGSAIPATSGDWCFGSNFNATNWKGEFEQVVVYRDELTDQERQNVEGYF